MRMVARYEELTGVGPDRDGFMAFPTIRMVYELCRCPACGELTLRRYLWDDRMDSEDVEMQYLYPAKKRTPKGLPPSIKAEYAKAQLLKKIDVDSYAVKLRRVLEMVCDDQGAKDGNLSDRLFDLSTKGEIPPKLKDVAQRLRDLGNFGAHASSGELSESEVPILDDLIEALLVYLYSAPSLVAAAKERIEALKNAKKRS